MVKNLAVGRNLDDLIGVLTLRTCNWVDTICQHDDLVDSSYYWQLIKNEIRDYQLDPSNQNVSGNWIRKQVGAGKKMPVRVFLKDDLIQINPTEIFDFEDILLTLAETDTERDIIILRFHGLMDGEIADKLRLEKTLVWRIRVGLEKRYEMYIQKEVL
jgi:hypothetical protein